MSKVTTSSVISKDKDHSASIRQSELDMTTELHKSRVEELKESKYGGIIKSAQDLIKVIDPKNLEDIRLLFSGLRIDLETFSRTIQTYIPAMYSDTEEAIELLALSIVDLFEEIDTDGDGYISWPDLIAYFIEASQAPQASKVTIAEAETFKQTQQSAQEFSGKTSLIQLDSVLPNNSQFNGLDGNSIIQVLKYQKQIFLITNTGIYQTDSTYLFPRLIFVPDENTIMASIKKGRKVILSNRERERREMNAKKKLEKLDYEMFGDNRYQFNMNKYNQKPVSNEPQTKYEIINSMKHSVINQKVDIVEAVVLEPYPLMAVMMKEPIFMIISLTGNQGVSAPFNLESAVTSSFWENKQQILYMGHQSGAVSAYKIVAKQAEHEIMAAAARAQADKEQLNLGLQTERFLEAQIAKLKEKYAPVVMNQKISDSRMGSSQDLGGSTGSTIAGGSVYDNEEFVAELFAVLKRLSKDQLFSLNPELRKLLLSEKELNLVQKDQAKNHLQALSKKLKELDQTPVVPHLLPTHIFNPHLSIIQSHGMKPVQLIKSDPEAFVRAEMQPTLKETAVAVKRFGGVQLDISAELLISRYVASGAIKRISGGWGFWEREHEEVFRVAAADSDGTVTIMDEKVGFVTCFARLHQEGVLRIHVFKDAVISVGYQKVYMLTREVIKSAFEGNIVKVEKEGLETMSSSLINGNVVLERKTPKETVELDTSRPKLMKAEIYKTKAMIRQIPPPRPQDTVLHSFQLNDVVGVVDYKYNVTFFNLVSGEHISRNAISASGLAGAKFGDASYFGELNYGVLPVGKYLFKITTVSNDLITNEQTEVWKYIDTLQKEVEDRQFGVEKTSLKVFQQKYDAVGSVGSRVVGYKFNRPLQELAVVTGPYEITIYSLLSGRPVRVIDVEGISRQYSEEQAGDSDEGGVKAQSYGLIETADPVGQQTENYLDRDMTNTQTVDDGKQRAPKQAPRDVKDLLEKPKEHKSSLPQLLDPVQQIKLKQQKDIRVLDMLGAHITALGCDEKGRVLFVFGTRGAITLYWKTGCLFDYQEVAEVGKKLIDEDLDTQVENPFVHTERRQLLKAEQDLSGGASKTIYCYSLNLDLNRIIRHVNSDLGKGVPGDHTSGEEAKIQKRQEQRLVGNSREVLLAADGPRKYFFFNDQLNKQEMLIITGACTRDYKSAPTNARILRMISIGATQVQFDACRIAERKFAAMLEASAPWQKFLASPDSVLKRHVLGGGHQAMCGGVVNGVCEVGANGRPVVPSSGRKSLLSRYLARCTAPDAEKTYSAQITQICIGEAIGLAAIGTSDGRVLLHDTTSTKFLKQSTTYLPRSYKAAAVTSMCFLGDLPLLFVGTASGACFIYTVRPMVPGDQLVVAFQHGSYNPVNYPLNLDYLENQEKNLKLLDYLLDRHKREMNEYLVQQRKYTEFIKMTCFTYDLFIRGEKSFFRGEDAHLIRNYMQEKLNKDIQEEAARQLQLSQQATQLLTAQLTTGLSGEADQEPDSSQGPSAVAGSAIGVNRPASTFSQFNGVQYVAKNSSIVLQRQQTTRNLKASSALSNKTQTELDISEITQENENEVEDENASNNTQMQAEMALDPTLMKLGRELACGQNQQPEQVNKFLRANRKRRALANKMKAAVLLMGLANNFLLPFMEIQNRFVVSDVVMSEYGKVVDEFGGDDDLEIRTDAPVTQRIEERVRLSEKSRDVIRKQQKLMSARPKRVEEPRYEKWVTPQEQLELHYERQGLRLRYDWDEGTKSAVQVPVRTRVLSSLSGASAVQAAAYDVAGEALLVADADGFVTRYDVSALLAAVGPEPVRLNKKQVLDVQSGRPQDIVIGFAGQRGRVTQTRLGAAALHARDALRIDFQCRAHEAPIHSIVDLRDGHLLTIGQDRRALVWEARTMILKGQLARVTLDVAPEGWEQLFGVDIHAQQPTLLKHSMEKQGEGKGTTKASGGTARLQLSDLGASTGSGELFPPAQRLECPPAAAYGWAYVPRLQYKSASLSVSLTAGQESSQGAGGPALEPLEATKTVLSRAAAVPTLESDADANLLRLTGLNPRVFARHCASWTVRAAVGRVTGGKVDPGTSGDEAKRLLLTGRPHLQKEDGTE